MKYIVILFIALLYLPVWGQQSDSTNRKLHIEQCTKLVYSITAFWQIADSLELTIDELCDYPVIFPIKKPRLISSGVGMRRHPFYRKQYFHTEIDIVERKGAPVYATGNGIVIGKGYNSGYGNYEEIQHTGGFRTFYGHLSRILVNVGDWVKITQQIACVGNTGVATGSHLHYEIRKGNRYLNPIGWCYCLSRMLSDISQQHKII